jgi:hypothetical protein
MQNVVTISSAPIPLHHPRPAARLEAYMTDPTSDPMPHDLSDAAAGHIEIPVATAADLQRLDRVRMDLLRVHRALLEAERARYEKVRGRIANNSAFLQLVINDPWFDWLRPMAQLVLLIDERTADKKQPLGTAEAGALFDRARSLLRADSEGDAFQRLFFQVVQTSPELAVLARQVAAGLASA